MMRRYFLFLLLFIGISFCQLYRGGELRTIDTYQYGRFEVRMKSAAGAGVVSSFFTYRDYWAEGLTGPQHWNEIDWEWLGNHDDKAQTNLITQNEWNHEELIDVGFNPHEDYHNYAFEWTPDYVAFFIENELVRMDNNFYVDSLYHYQKIMMNIWQPTYVEWVGEFESEILPVYAFYDWAKYYAYVPGSGNAGTENNFSMSWEDEFDSWDTNRWEKSTHTFDNNAVRFIEENVVFHEGNMILCMTTPNNTGYNNENPEYTLNNPGFESNFDNWSVWPENHSNYSIVTEPVLYGNHSLKLFGQFSGTTNDISVYQNFIPSAGEEFTFSGSVYTAFDDHISGDNTAFLEIVFFNENWDVLEQPVSSSITSSSPADQWIPLSVSGIAPIGVTSFNIAVKFIQVNDAGGSVYFDDLRLSYPNLSTSSDITSVNYTLLKTYPNPFNKRVVIQFKVEDPSPVVLIIVNMLGQHIKTVIKDDLDSGEYKLSWDGTDYIGKELPSGVYFAMLKIMVEIEVQKIILLK